jgi:GNAT superfamily N-acetyltransferase
MSTLQSDLGPIRLETARPDDLPVVMGILDECATWLHSRGIAQWALPQPPHEWEKMRVQIALGHVSLARMEADRSLVGTLRIEWEDPFWGDHGAGEAGYVHALAIRDHVRGHGLGVQLLQWAEAQTASRGRSYIRVDCWAENAHLRRYYESLGFQYRGDFMDGAWRGALYEKEAAP